MLALNFILVAFVGVLGVLIYSNTNTSFSIRRKQKRITKKSKLEQLQDYLIIMNENFFWFIKALSNPSTYSEMKINIQQFIHRSFFTLNKRSSQSFLHMGRSFYEWSFSSLIKTWTSLISLIVEFFYNSLSLLFFFFMSQPQTDLHSQPIIISNNNNEKHITENNNTNNNHSNTNNNINNTSNSKNIIPVENKINILEDKNQFIVQEPTTPLVVESVVIPVEKIEGPIIHYNDNDVNSQLSNNPSLNEDLPTPISTPNESQEPIVTNLTTDIMTDNDNTTQNLDEISSNYCY